MADIGTMHVLKMGVAGVAAATVAAQGISAVCSFAILLRTLKKYEEESWRRFDKAQLGRMTRIALPSILQQSIVSIGMMLVQSVVNGFGSSVLAGYSAGMRIVLLPNPGQYSTKRKRAKDKVEFVNVPMN